ncbi:MAG: serine/threonine protein kinase [Kiritimatiellia bacterium]|jgi:serine/threonine protein kinase
MLLPKKVGPITLMRRLGMDAVSESYAAILDEPAGKQVVARRLLPWVVRDAARLANVESRVQDLTAVRHPILIPTLEVRAVGDERFVLEEWVDVVDLDEVIAWCRQSGNRIPHNVFLNLATQICNGLEALHGRPGKASGAENVLHLGLSPAAVKLTAEGRLLVGDFGLVRSPTVPASGVSGTAAARLEYLSPEQTHADQRMIPASDIFTLGSVLFELLTLEPLFRRASNLQTIHAVRKTEVSAALQRIKRELPGLDKVLYRALSLNPRHRYQRAFVLREDVRGLMAGYSFTRISEETVAFLAPMFEARSAQKENAAVPDQASQDSTGMLLQRALDASRSEANEPDTTLAFLRQSQPTPPPAAPPAPATDELDSLDGLEMWSEVPTTVDVDIDIDIDEPSPAVPLDQTSWIRRDPNLSTTEFDTDEATDITASPLTPPPAPTTRVARPGLQETLPPGFADSVPIKRQATPAEAAALGLRRVRPAQETPARPTQPPHRPPTPQVPPNLRSVKPESVTRAADTPPTAPQPATPAPRPSEVVTPLLTQASALTERAPVQTRPQASPPDDSFPAHFNDDGAEDTIVEVEDDLNWRPKRSKTWIWVAAAVAVLFVLVVIGVAVIVAAGAIASSGLLAFNTNSTPGPTLTTTPVTAPIASTPAPPATTPGSTTASATAPPTPPAAAPVTPVSTTAPTAAVSTTPAAPAPTTPVRTIPSTNRIRPTPARTTPSTARITPTPVRTTPVRTAPTRTPTRTPISSPSSDGVASIGGGFDDPGEETNSLIQTPPTPTDRSTIDGLADKAGSGRLSAADKLTLEMTDGSDLNYTRAYTLLYTDAKVSGDTRGRSKYLDALLTHPENQYNPALLAEGAHTDIKNRRYQQALDRAKLAERHWARLPPEMIFSRKAMIYEAQAAAWQGKFYTSGGSDTQSLESAIKSWERYQRHVTNKKRTDLSQVADDQLAKLYDARRRLE